MEKYYFVSYSSTLADKPSIPVFGNSILKIDSDQKFVLIRELENYLKKQSPTLHFVILNFIPISKEQFDLEMRNFKS